MLSGCSTSSALVRRSAEIFVDIPSNTATGIAVFVNWPGQCEPGTCSSHREQMQEKISKCIADGMSLDSRTIGIFDGGALLDLDTSGLTQDPRKSGSPDARFNDQHLVDLQRRSVSHGLIVDIRSTTREAGVSQGVLFGGEGGVVIGKASRSNVDTSVQALLVELPNRRWLAKLEAVYSGTEASILGLLVPLVILPVGWATSNSTLPVACEAIAQRIGIILREGARRLPASDESNFRRTGQ